MGGPITCFLHRLYYMLLYFQPVALLSSDWDLSLICSHGASTRRVTWPSENRNRVSVHTQIRFKARQY